MSTFDENKEPLEGMTPEKYESIASNAYKQGWPWFGEARLASQCAFLERALREFVCQFENHGIDVETAVDDEALKWYQQFEKQREGGI